MTEIVHIVGARPNFPKAGPVIAGLAARDADQMLVHTGQHYDDSLSESFFRDLGLPRADVALGVGSGSHATQTAAIMVELESVFTRTRPRLVVVYGDVNSTVAAALVAAKLHIEVAHVEAGLRSFDMGMPEEVNRRLTDQLSRLLLVTSADAVGHLAREGVPGEWIHFVGNPMIDTLVANLDKFDPERAREELGLDEDYAVATLHRPSNVDDPSRAREVVACLADVLARIPVVLPLHPRGRANLYAAGLGDLKGLQVVEPVGYIQFMSLVRGARAVITDSGGVQEETTVLGVPCLTLRANTERPVTITHGTNRLTDLAHLPSDLDQALAGRTGPGGVPPLWDGHAGPRIADVISDHLTGSTT